MRKNNNLGIMVLIAVALVGLGAGWYLFTADAGPGKAVQLVQADVAQPGRLAMVQPPAEGEVIPQPIPPVVRPQVLVAVHQNAEAVAVTAGVEAIQEMRKVLGDNQIVAELFSNAKAMDLNKYPVVVLLNAQNGVLKAYVSNRDGLPRGNQFVEAATKAGIALNEKGADIIHETHAQMMVSDFEHLFTFEQRPQPEPDKKFEERRFTLKVGMKSAFRIAGKVFRIDLLSIIGSRASLKVNDESFVLKEGKSKALVDGSKLTVISVSKDSVVLVLKALKGAPAQQADTFDISLRSNERLSKAGKLSAPEMELLKSSTVSGADGKVDVRQLLVFAPSVFNSKTGTVVYEENEFDELGHHLFFDDGDFVFMYSWDVEGEYTSRLDANGRLVDFVGDRFNVMGERYTVADAAYVDGVVSFVFRDTNGNLIEWADDDVAGAVDHNQVPQLGIHAFGNIPRFSGQMIEDAAVAFTGVVEPDLAHDTVFRLKSVQYLLRADARLGDVYLSDDPQESLRSVLDEPEGIPGMLDVRYVGKNAQGTHTVRLFKS